MKNWRRKIQRHQGTQREHKHPKQSGPKASPRHWQNHFESWHHLITIQGSAGIVSILRNGSKGPGNNLKDRRSMECFLSYMIFCIQVPHDQETEAADSALDGLELWVLWLIMNHALSSHSVSSLEVHTLFPSQTSFANESTRQIVNKEILNHVES